MCIFLIMCTLYSYFIFVACFFLCLSAMCSFFRNSLFCGNFCCYWKGNCHKKWHSSHNSHMIIEYARNFRSILIWRLHNQRWIASDLFILIFAVFCMEISQRRHIHTHTHIQYIIHLITYRFKSVLVAIIKVVIGWLCFVFNANVYIFFVSSLTLW